MLEFSNYPKIASVQPNNLRTIKADVLVRSLTERGTSVLKVLWLGLGPLRLPIEDDVMFLLDAYHELPAFQSGAIAEHSIYLGDGELHMIAKRVDGTDSVWVKCGYAPFLRKSIASTSEHVMPLSIYVQAWDVLIAGLVSLPTNDFCSRQT